MIVNSLFTFWPSEQQCKRLCLAKKTVLESNKGKHRENYFLQNIFYSYLHKNTMIQKHPNPVSQWDAFNSNPRLYELLLCSKTKLTLKPFTRRQIVFNFKVRVRKAKTHHFMYFVVYETVKWKLTIIEIRTH